MATTNNVSSNLVYQPINDEYEWIRYNNRLRLIHSIKDDMYQMQSILDACGSNKLPANWFENASTKELLLEFSRNPIDPDSDVPDIMFDKRTYLNNELRGYYVHRLLVNAVAMWASPKYAIHVFKLLDAMATNERKALQQTIATQEQTINQRQSRLVPSRKEKNYKYLIWKEELPNDPDMILLHLIKRNNRSFSQVSSHYKNENECWFYRDNLPIAMTVNEDVKQLVKQTLAGSEYDIHGSTIMTYKEYLPRLHEVITQYFNEFQQ